ncbi:c-type cytochrome [Luteolibacter marinus]|uniref:c-type cytochrome n=1 Tax=Luteolibacter marinus TaxID=2776705 RepID=UPI0018660778|nr:c-type cytochrome [Luteolibacter marinus]
MQRFLAILLFLFTALMELAPGGEPVIRWIWSESKAKPEERVFFRREFELPPGLEEAVVTLTCDNWNQLWINGNDLGVGWDWDIAQNYEITRLLKPGRNLIAVEGRNAGGSAGLALRLRATLKDGSSFHVVTEGEWQCSREAGDGWQLPDFQPVGWKPVAVVGKMGDKPWGPVILAEHAAAEGPEEVTDDFKVAPGFRLERIMRVAKDRGSWVAMTVDGAGRLICSDQYGGLYRVTPALAGGGGTSVEPLPVPLKGAHGLLWHQGVLYVSVNEGSDQSGVWRVIDSNGDGEPDKPELMKAFRGRGEHGPHGFAASPDGRWIYFVAGNHTDLAELDSSLVSRNWGEDQLLPRRPDGRGHARDRMAPGGFVVRFKPDGSDWQLVATGFRNAYGLAFNTAGDLFTYDSDMEWDLGMPWYRPTRICQVVPGAEFGWRNGTGKWPAYYEDSMPPLLDIGPGSPTGVISGRGAKFPEKYQKAIYALDWTYATIHAIHLVPDGAGYRAEREELVAGTGLPLTDAVVGHDGAMYFLTGGRRTDSALWRVTYTGSAPVEPAGYAGKALELMDRAGAWEALGSPDRVRRFEGRVALEAGDTAGIAAKLGAENDPWRVIGGVMALARTGGGHYRETMLSALGRLDFSSLDNHQRINALRACGLVFIRHGEPSPQERDGILSRIDAAYPSGDPDLDRELCRMLCYLQAPGVVGRTLDLMDTAGPTPAPDWLSLAERNANYGKTVREMIANLPPAQVIHYVYCLRVVKGPWTQDERKRFFAWFGKLLQSSGGNSYAPFIADLRKETLATCTPGEREWIAKLDPLTSVGSMANLPQPKGPGRNWTVDEVSQLDGPGLEGRKKTEGRKMFEASLCAACHRFAGAGGSAGPDLTALGGRFSVRDLAEAIIDPSKVISDQFAFDLITKTDGTVISGKLVDEKDKHWIIATNPFDFSQTVEIESNQVKGKSPSPVSPMPPGLINRLNEDELKDLLAYLLGK